MELPKWKLATAWPKPERVAMFALDQPTLAHIWRQNLFTQAWPSGVCRSICEIMFHILSALKYVKSRGSPVSALKTRQAARPVEPPAPACPGEAFGGQVGLEDKT